MSARRWMAVAIGLFALVGCDRGAPTEAPEKAPTGESKAGQTPAVSAEKATAPAADTPTAATARPADSKASTPISKRSTPISKTGPLPGSDRVFVVPDGDSHLVLGADGDRLWAVRPGTPGSGEMIWRIQGPGVVHAVAYGDVGQGQRIFAARGVGRGFLQAPLVIESIDPATGQRSELWRRHGERNQVAGLQVADVDGDGKAELAVAHYASKYMVEPVILSPGKAPVPGAQIRMASSWLHAELDGAPGIETVIGRVYGDAKGLPGDLRIRRGAGGEVAVPTDRGVKSLMFGRGKAGAPALYFVDGWEADYGKKATARIKRVGLVNGALGPIETIGASPDEFTFFALTPVDLDGDGVTEIAAQGNKRVSLFEQVDGAWKSRPLADLEPVLNTAIGRESAGWTLYVPAKPVTRAVRLAPR